PCRWRTGRDVPVRRRRVAERFHAELAILEDLGVSQDDLGAGRSGEVNSQAADEVLPEIEDGAARRRLPDVDGRALLDASDRRPEAGPERGGNWVEKGHRRPRAIVVGNRGPIRQLEAGVVVLAVVDARPSDRTGRPPPRPVSDDAQAAP